MGKLVFTFKHFNKLHCMPQLSIWEKESFFAPQDIIIIGSGFVGLWSALHLIESNPNKKITILERGLIPTGASTRNAGFSCFGSPSELVADVAAMGEDKMWQLVAMRYKGLLQIRQHFAEETIGYDSHGGYECFTKDSKDWEACAEKMDWLNNGLQSITGVPSIFTIADEKLNQFGFEGFEHLIENPLEAGLHAGKLVQALLRKIQGLGVQVLTGIEVTGYTENNQSITVTTNQQLEFSCRQLLLCTNAFTKKLLPQLDIRPCRGQILLTSPIPNFTIKGTFHFDEGYYYFRNLDDRLLLGGARNKAFDDEATETIDTTEIIQQTLEEFTRRHLLPGINFTITNRWSGIMAMGNDKLPIVKAISNQVYCCVRMSGMGVALAPGVGEQITVLMNERG